MKRNSIMIVIILTFFMSGYAYGETSTLDNDTVILGQPLYANMVKVGDVYRIAEISNGKGLPNPVFKLNTLQPEFDTSCKTCMTTYGKNKKSTSTYGWFEGCNCRDASIFRKCSIDISDTIKSQLILPGLSLLFGFHSYNYYFDSEEYTKAINDVTVDLDKSARRELIEEYTKLNNSIIKSKSQIRQAQYTGESEVFKVIDQIQKVIDEIQKDIDIVENKDYKILHKLSFKTEIKDLSGFYDKKKTFSFKKTILPHDYLGIRDKVKRNRVKRSRVEDISLPEYDVITASPNEFLSGVNSVYERYEGMILTTEKKWSGELIDTKSKLVDIESLRLKIKADLDEKISTPYEIRITEPTTYETKPYHISITHPSQVSYKGKSVSVPVTVKILSRDFETTFPSYSGGDQNLSIEFDGKSLMLVNNTDKYLTVNTISAYHNSDISNYKADIELAPSSKLSNPINIKTIASNTILKNATYENMTAKEARKQTVEFGFAVKYRLIDQGIEKTISPVKEKVNLYKMLAGSI